GVNVMGQGFHFESYITIPSKQWKYIFNHALAEEIDTVNIEHAADDFHARYLATKKEYRYYILKEKVPDVFTRNYVYQYTGQLDREAMRKACAYVIGEHDFTTFSSAKSTVTGSEIRTLEQLEFK